MSRIEETLVESTEERLEKVFGAEEDFEPQHEPAADPVEPAEEPTPEPGQEPVVEPDPKPADEPAEEPEPTPEEEGAVQEESGLPDSYYRAAIHQEWTPEEVEAFYKSDPVKATKTFKRMYDSTNKLTAEFARIGRMKTEAPAAEPAASAEDETLAMLKEQYGGDDPLVQTIERLQNKLSALTPQSAPQPQVGPPATGSSDVALQQIINGFFSADDMKPFAEFYGVAKDGLALPQEQFNKRMATLELADNILAGAAKLGRKMDVPEALSLAHLTISEPFRERAIRADLKAKITKRAKSVSLEPASGRPMPSSGTTSASDLEAKVASKMASLFNR